MHITCARNNNVKSYVQLILKAHFCIFCIFVCKPKYSCTIMYACEKSLPPHELSYIGLFKFFHQNLFHVNAICKKQPYDNLGVFFPFFGTPTMNGPFVSLFFESRENCQKEALHVVAQLQNHVNLVQKAKMKLCKHYRRRWMPQKCI